MVEVWVPYSLSQRLSSEAREGSREGREGSFSPPLLRASLWERRARGERGDTRVFRELSGEAREFLEERGEARRLALEDRGDSAPVEESGEITAPRLADCTLTLTGLYRGMWRQAVTTLSSEYSSSSSSSSYSM